MGIGICVVSARESQGQPHGGFTLQTQIGKNRFASDGAHAHADKGLYARRQIDINPAAKAD